MRLIDAVAGTCAIVGLVARQTTQVAPSPTERNGTFTFHEALATGPFDGTFVVTPDTVTLTTSVADCSYDQRSRGANAIVYACGTLTVAFTRSDPQYHPQYVHTHPAMKNVEECVASRMDPKTGAEVCTRTQTRQEGVDVTDRGQIHPRRVVTTTTH